MSPEANPDPDQALVARMQAGDEAALSEIMRRHGPRLKALALRFASATSSVDDIVQETFWTAWRTASQWQPGGPPYGAYLTRIAVNRAIDVERRSKLRRFFGLEAADGVVDGAVSAEHGLALRGEAAAVAADIGTLPPRQRAAILLSASEELSNADIAVALGVSEGAAEQLLVRARRVLRERMAERNRSKEQRT